MQCLKYKQLSRRNIITTLSRFDALCFIKKKKNCCLCHVIFLLFFSILLINNVNWDNQKVWYHHMRKCKRNWQNQSVESGRNWTTQHSTTTENTNHHFSFCNFKNWSVAKGFKEVIITGMACPFILYRGVCVSYARYNKESKHILYTVVHLKNKNKIRYSVVRYNLYAWWPYIVNRRGRTISCCWFSFPFFRITFSRSRSQMVN